ncbi:hypothetical protein [Legionella septentrionalis]|uniref:hypothetical protein n=1 Tax=Legionella septentrionalis TaxID=2498109 RepID=UPI000F8E0210|nr:hypothetical protein [Legionella septentrionalis]RUQ93072.1 hypothetical protein ELY11_11945 [Legionella septentrionalis]
MQCPYCEGEYIYIYGGPYDAQEELDGQFSGEVSDEVISELADELSTECPYWSGKEGPYYDLIEPDPEYYSSFIQSIDQIKEMIETKFDSKTQNFLLKLLYANVITALETFLSEAFITVLFSDVSFVIQFVEKNDDFKKRKILLSDLYKEYNKIHTTIQTHLSNLIWHNISKIKRLYECTFDITFSDEITSIYKAITKRHDLIHRGGKNKNGDSIEITLNELKLLINDILFFVNDLHSKLLECQSTISPTIDTF